MSPTSKPAKPSRKPRGSVTPRSSKPTSTLTRTAAPVVQLAAAGAPSLDASASDVSSDRGAGKARADLARWWESMLEHFENVVHYVVAAILMAVVVFTLYETTGTLAHSIASSSVPAVVMNVVNGVIFAVIILEITRTMLSRFDKELQLQRLLTVGTVCAVRDVLSVGAGLSLNDMAGKHASHTSLSELGINAAVVVGMAVSLVLVRRYGSTSSDGEGQSGDGADGATR